MNWKKAVSVMLVGIMALSMTACGDSGETSTDAASGGGSTAESTEGAGTSASGDDKLVVWTLSNDLIDFGERFEEQTGVAVDTVVIEPANYPTKVQTALLGGESEPDIIVGEPKMLEDFYDAGFFEDLNQAPYNAQDYADQIVDYVWKVGQDPRASREPFPIRSPRQVSITEEILPRKYSERMIRMRSANYLRITRLFWIPRRS